MRAGDRGGGSTLTAKWDPEKENAEPQLRSSGRRVLRICNMVAGQFLIEEGPHPK